MPLSDPPRYKLLNDKLIHLTQDEVRQFEEESDIAKEFDNKLCKFLENDDLALVRMGISLAKGADVPITYEHLDQFLESEQSEETKLEILWDDEYTKDVADEYLGYSGILAIPESYETADMSVVDWETKANLLKNFSQAKEYFEKEKIYPILEEMIEYSASYYGDAEQLSEPERDPEINLFLNSLELLSIIANDKDKIKLTKLHKTLDKEGKELIGEHFESAIENAGSGTWYFYSGLYGM